MTTSFPSAVAAYEQKRLADARNNGFALFPVRSGANAPAFIYTVGMSQHGLPELLVFCSDEMGAGTCNMLSQVAAHLIEGSKMFDIKMLLSAFLQNGITVSDPTIHYQPHLLTGDTYKYALTAYLTRAMRFRNALGMPVGVLELRHEGVPSLEQIRATVMLAAS